MGPFHCFKVIYEKREPYQWPWATVDSSSLSVSELLLHYSVGPWFEFTSRQVAQHHFHRIEDALFWLLPWPWGRETIHLAAVPNPCLNTSINNPLSKVYCQVSLALAEEEARGDKIAKEKQLMYSIYVSHRATGEQRWTCSNTDTNRQCVLSVHMLFSTVIVECGWIWRPYVFEWSSHMHLICAHAPCLQSSRLLNGPCEDRQNEINC